MNNTAGQVKDAPSQFNEAPACILTEADTLLNDGFTKYLLSAPQGIELKTPPYRSRTNSINELFDIILI
jgi:hypothetical protein